MTRKRRLACPAGLYSNSSEHHSARHTMAAATPSMAPGLATIMAAASEWLVEAWPAIASATAEPQLGCRSSFVSKAGGWLQGSIEASATWASLWLGAWRRGWGVRIRILCMILGVSRPGL